jgi:ATP-dependent helicase/nuclease subunit B
MLPKPELFARLAEGHAAGVTVVTPNVRLAQELVAEFDALQIAKGLAQWDAPDILFLPAFVERLWEEALVVSERGANLPVLLSPAQEQHLWEQILEKSGLLAVQQAAAQCREAWNTMHAWRVGSGPGNEDAAAFVSWSKEYQRRTRGEVDAARLPDVVADFIETKPKLLVAYAFDIVPPQAKDFLARFELVQCEPESRQGRAARCSFPSAKEEIDAAARWARARLEEGMRRIGVVVPDLRKRRREVARIFSRVMQPGYNLPGAAKAPMPFNISLGLPLESYPLVGAALDLLELAFGAIAFERASRLVRSPFLFGAEGERARRATLDAWLRKNLDATVSLAKLVGAAERCPQLRACLEQAFDTVKNVNALTPSEWARHFSAVLDAAGFPGERVLDSDEFQTLAKWHEALSELSRLERVSKGMSSRECLAVLRRLCADTLFQPESPDAPVQVLGVLESTGLRFDCLWISGLTDEAWPLPARPNPFIPVSLQKKAGIPQASAESSLELDRRLTAEWGQAAEEVVFSFPAKDKDRDVAPSALILGIAQGTLAIPEFPRYRDLLFDARRLESFDDPTGPAFAGREVRGGTRVLADQAACPFRAFAKWRLAAEELEEPIDVPDARTRGVLLHAFMKHVWLSLKDSSSLKSDVGPALVSAADAAVKEVEIEGRFADLERARLVRLGREWLQIEATRAPFAVKLAEEKRTIEVAGLQFSARIDRMDELAGGGHALIDYKTGQVSRNAWLGERPDEPQVPLYALSAPPPVAAVVFAQLKTGEMRFRGYSKDKGLLPKVDQSENWDGLLAVWKKETDALGAGFAAGEARVDPKNGLATCRLCHLQTLCRVHDKPQLLKGEE